MIFNSGALPAVAGVAIGGERLKVDVPHGCALRSRAIDQSIAFETYVEMVLIAAPDGVSFGSLFVRDA